MRQGMLVAHRGLRLSAEVPETRRERARGLLGRDGLHPGGALLFERARSVHTVGMRFEIAVAFLDADLRVLELVRVPPGRVLLPRRGARHVLELPADTTLREGDQLRRDPMTGRTTEQAADDLRMVRRFLALYFRGCPRVGGAGSSAPIV